MENSLTHYKSHTIKETGFFIIILCWHQSFSSVYKLKITRAYSTHKPTRMLRCMYSFRFHPDFPLPFLPTWWLLFLTVTFTLSLSSSFHTHCDSSGLSRIVATCHHHSPYSHTTVIISYIENFMSRQTSFFIPKIRVYFILFFSMQLSQGFEC